jgi:hypothetical protein
MVVKNHLHSSFDVQEVVSSTRRTKMISETGLQYDYYGRFRCKQHRGIYCTVERDFDRTSINKTTGVGVP